MGNPGWAEAQQAQQKPAGPVARRRTEGSGLGGRRQLLLEFGRADGARRTQAVLEHDVRRAIDAMLLP